jgi:probable rRNA maturation factor
MPEPTSARRKTARASVSKPEAARKTRARAPAGTILEVSVADERGRRLARPSLARWLSRVAPARATGTVTVALVSDACIRSLNRKYRRRNYATDVLAFSAAPQSPSSHPRFLGDIVIARGVARRQARAALHSEQTELKVLALHGLLHLLGYDHERDNGSMLRLERRLRRRGGLREAPIERAGPRARR